MGGTRRQSFVLLWGNCRGGRERGKCNWTIAFLKQTTKPLQMEPWIDTPPTVGPDYGYRLPVIPQSQETLLGVTSNGPNVGTLMIYSRIIKGGRGRGATKTRIISAFGPLLIKTTNATSAHAGSLVQSESWVQSWSRSRSVQLEYQNYNNSIFHWVNFQWSWIIKDPAFGPLEVTT